MRHWTYYCVEYQGKVRLETLNRQEAENYARALWSRDDKGAAPTIDEYKRESTR